MIVTLGSKIGSTTTLKQARFPLWAFAAQMRVRPHLRLHRDNGCVAQVQAAKAHELVPSLHEITAVLLAPQVAVLHVLHVEQALKNQLV